jgi:hypothetical protein
MRESAAAAALADEVVRLRNQWQTIDSAPGYGGKKHGPMLLVSDGAYVYQAFWNGHHWDDGDFSSTMTGMTHWMPVPELPK